MDAFGRPFNVLACPPKERVEQRLENNVMTEGLLTVLGIETSCDETAASVVRRHPSGHGEILSNVVRAQLDLHAAYGGVVPEIAARAHIDLLEPSIQQAMAESGLDYSDMDGIAATAGPGLIGGLIVGVTTAKAIALGLGRPFVAVNHLEAHALSAGLTDNLRPPYLLLLVSGGHTQLLIVKDVGAYERLGTTLDDALGEAFDKAAKLLGPRLSRRPGSRALRRARSPHDQAAAAHGRSQRAAFLPSRGSKQHSAGKRPRGRRLASRTLPTFAPASRRPSRMWSAIASRGR